MYIDMYVYVCIYIYIYSKAGCTLRGYYQSTNDLHKWPHCNPCTWAPSCISYDVAIGVLVINERAHWPSSWLHRYYCHLTSVGFPHSVCHESLLASSCGKGIVRSVTLFAIQALFRPKTLVKHSNFKVGHLTVVCLLKCRISVEVPSVDKAKMQCRERFNITTKLHIGPKKKNPRYYSSIFMNIKRITVIIGLMNGSSS